MYSYADAINPFALGLSISFLYAKKYYYKLHRTTVWQGPLCVSWSVIGRPIFSGQWTKTLIDVQCLRSTIFVCIHLSNMHLSPGVSTKGVYLLQRTFIWNVHSKLLNVGYFVLSSRFFLVFGAVNVPHALSMIVHFIFLNNSCQCNLVRWRGIFVWLIYIYMCHYPFFNHHFLCNINYTQQLFDIPVG